MKYKDVQKNITTKLIEAIYLVIISLIFLFISIFNFAQFEFEWERIFDASFWVVYTFTIFLGIVVFFFSIGNSKRKHKRGKEFLGLMSEIFNIASIIQFGFSTLFDIEIGILNETDSLKIYKIRLKRKWDFISNLKLPKRYKENKLNRIKELLDNAEKDIKHKKIWGFKPITSNEICSGYSPNTTIRTANMHYTGHENLTIFLLPSLIIGLIFTAVMLGSGFSEKTTTIDTVIQLIARLITMIMFVIRGDNYGEYSINTVYTSALNERKSFMSEFIMKQGHNIEFILDKGKSVDFVKDENGKTKMSIKQEIPEE